jgi:hypothetical protein
MGSVMESYSIPIVFALIAALAIILAIPGRAHKA